MINVKDINDLRPQFDPEVMNLTLRRDVTKGTHVVLVEAWDGDVVCIIVLYRNANEYSTFK